MSGLLGNIYSAGDRMKRKLGGLLSNPLENIALGSTRMAEDMNALSALASEAGYMPNTVNRSDQSVLATLQQKALARQMLADKGADMGMAAATVWHGSPHKFDKFDSKKIGTGEGAQAYGHGLYLAQEPSVARNYLTPNVPASDGTRVGGQLFQDWKQAATQGIQTKTRDRALLSKILGGARNESEIPTMRGLMQKQHPDYDFSTVDSLLKKAQQEGIDFNAAGNLYKVDLPDNAITRMLDWDKPLSQQAPEVQQALQKSGLLKADGSLSFMYNETPRAGSDMYERITSPLAKKIRGEDDASTFLRKQGIPGIRYLDGGSRGAGQGSSNYVVFPGNEDLLQILERNGVPIK
jgi:hypothetical protein